MAESKKLILRSPLITWERAKVSLFIVVYVVLAEYVDPRPFRSSAAARLLYFVLVAEIIRQVWVWRLEVSRLAVFRSSRIRSRWERARSRLAADLRYRLRRLLFALMGLYVFGWALDVLTDRCSGAIQCALLAPLLAVENLPMALQIFFYTAISLFQLGLMFWTMTKVGSYKLVYPGTIDVSFADVYGQDRARDKVMEQVQLLESDERIEAAGGYMPKGMLLHGPPGTGKTLLARAAAGATTKPLILVPPGAFASTFIGINFLKVGGLFRRIRKLAIRYGGVVVFVDELDSLGSRGDVEGDARPAEGCMATVGPRPSVPRAAPRTTWVASMVNGLVQPFNVNMGGSNMGTLEAFLAAMDGMDEPRGLVNKLLVIFGFKPLSVPPYRYLMLGATNRMDAIDAALLRAGRFGRKVKVGYPDFGGRVATYRGYLGKIENHDLSDEQVEWIARNHWHGTGAEIEDIVNEAVLLTFRDDALADGVVTFGSIMQSMVSVRYGEGDGKFENEQNQWRVAIHEAGHAVATHHLRRDRNPIWFATIEQHGDTGGMVASSSLDDDWIELNDETRHDIQVSLASRVAERFFFGQLSNGHGGDGRAATRQAIELAQRGGGGRISFLDNRTTGDLRLELGEEGPLARIVEQILRDAESDVKSLLRPRQAQVAVVASMLWGEGLVEGDRLHAVLDVMEGWTDKDSEGWAGPAPVPKGLAA
jgi:ATP-dependent Zn protease